jgi:hypothetical protein
MTPNFAVIRIQNNKFWGFPIIIPIFLLWIPALLLAPFVLIVLGALCVATDVSFGRTIAAFWNLACGLPGTDVRVCADGKRITVRIL